MPSIFLAMIAASCCLWAVDTTYLFQEQLRFSTMTQTERNSEELNFLTQAWNREQDSFDRFRLDGYDLCETCFTDFFMIAPSTWQNRKNSVRAGNRTWEHGGTGHSGRTSESGYFSRIWMAEYFFTLGDYQPDTGQIHLPPGDRNDIYEEMRHDLSGQCVASSTFYEIWSSEFSHVKQPPQQRLGKCKKCDTFHKRIMGTRDKDVRARVKVERREHMKNVKADRLVYHTWRKRCREEPNKFMCITLDGMDQSKTDIPNYNTSENVASLVVRVVGALVHGPQKLAYAFLVTEFTKETNTNIEVLRRVLDDQEHLPPTLVLQLDNTSQENKNSHLFAFLAELVEAGVFERIIVNFLPVGHTHVRALCGTVLLARCSCCVCVCVCVLLGGYRSNVFLFCPWP